MGSVKVREAVLEDARKVIVGGREDTYGGPEDNFDRIADLWTMRRNEYVSKADVALDMILLKVARLQQTPGHYDSWVDIAGYAACGAEVAGCLPGGVSEDSPDFCEYCNGPCELDQNTQPADKTAPADPAATAGKLVDAAGPVASAPTVQDMVAEFHNVFDMPDLVAEGREKGGLVLIDRVDLRVALIAEEFTELLEAVYGDDNDLDPTGGDALINRVREACNDLKGVVLPVGASPFSREESSADYYDKIVPIADALADLVYVAYGAALEFGIDLDAVIREVHASNMSKLNADGTVLRRDDGKILKGDGFFAPRITKEMVQAGA